MLALCFIDGELKISKNVSDAKNYGLWIHTGRDIRNFCEILSIPKDIVDKELKSYRSAIYSFLLVPFNGYLHKLHILLLNGKIYSWDSEIPEDYIKNIMEYCITNDFRQLNLILETIISYTVEKLYSTLESLTLEIDKFEEVIAQKPELRRLHRILSKARRLRKAIFQINSFTSRIALGRKVSEQLVDDVRRLLDHADRLLERITMLTQFHYMVLSDRVNNVVQKLTIISAIFLPLTLIASIYGMNFRYMPELGHPLAYPAVLIVMASIAVGQLIYFKRKKWI